MATSKSGKTASVVAKKTAKKGASKSDAPKESKPKKGAESKSGGGAARGGPRGGRPPGSYVVFKPVVDPKVIPPDADALTIFVSLKNVKPGALAKIQVFLDDCEIQAVVAISIRT